MNLASIKSALGMGSARPARKPYTHRVTFAPAYHALPGSIAEEYQGGASLLAIAFAHRSTGAAVRAKLVSLGIPIRKQGITAGHSSVQKLSAEQIAWILEQDSNDVAHAEIARHVNVTRERVRQICLQNGRASRQSRMTKSMAVREARVARQQERQRFIQGIAVAWKNGVTLEELSALMGMEKFRASSVVGRISNYRKLYPDLFPYRHSAHWNAATHRRTAEERRARATAIAEQWKAGIPFKQIAQACGYKNASSVYAGIKQFRFKYPDLFPPEPRKLVSEEKMQRASEGWRNGVSTEQIARELGYTHSRSLYNSIAHWRESHPDLFPRRKTGPKSYRAISATTV